MSLSEFFENFSRKGICERSRIPDLPDFLVERRERQKNKKPTFEVPGHIPLYFVARRSPVDHIYVEIGGGGQIILKNMVEGFRVNVVLFIEGQDVLAAFTLFPKGKLYVELFGGSKPGTFCATIQ